MWLELQIFGFRALWSPYFLLYVIGIGVLYILITGKFRHKLGGDEKPTKGQYIQFFSGLLLLYAIKGSPVDLLSHIMLTAHMIQMAIFYLVFPILIIRGIPRWVWEKVVYQRFIYPVVKLMTKPLISLLLFNTLFSLYHLPAVFDFSKSSQIAHSSIAVIILIAAFILWWPVASPLKEFDTMHPLAKIFYIFANGVLITPACVLIIFSDTPLFDSYSADGAWIQALSLCVPPDVLNGISSSISGPSMFSGLSIMYDQQLGGIVMKLMQEAVYGFMLSKVFFEWFGKKSQTIDPLPGQGTISEHATGSYQ